MNALLEARVTAILRSPKPGTAPLIKTSPAFAARFQAEADRSGLTVDLEEKETEQMVRVCTVCGAQNSRFVETCFNCQSDLAAPPPPRPKVKERQLDAARWNNISRVPAPLTLRVPVNAERFRAPQAVTVNPTDVLTRFLSVFVEREKHRPAPPELKRFDEQSMFDRFLSVFVERQG